MARCDPGLRQRKIAGVGREPRSYCFAEDLPEVDVVPPGGTKPWQAW